MATRRKTRSSGAARKLELVEVRAEQTRARKHGDGLTNAELRARDRRGLKERTRKRKLRPPGGWEWANGTLLPTDRLRVDPEAVAETDDLLVKPDAHHWRRVEELELLIVEAKAQKGEDQVPRAVVDMVNAAYAGLNGLATADDEWKRLLATGMSMALRSRLGARVSERDSADGLPPASGFRVRKWLESLCRVPTELTWQRISAGLDRATLGRGGGRSGLATGRQGKKQNLQNVVKAIIRDVEAEQRAKLGGSR